MTLSQAAARELSALLGDRFSDARGVCEQHARGFAHHAPAAPDAVVFPRSTDDVAAVMRTCALHGVPVVPFGAGTSVEGQVHAIRGGISVDLSGMDQIVAVHAQDLTAIVQPGVRRMQLNTYLRDTGLFFPIDPGADATIGGMASTRASGTNAVRYGTMKDNVLALEVVTPAGEIIHTSRRAPKSSAGYDLTRLFIGSEGTLGIVTRISLKLYAIPEAVSVAICPFPSIADAVNCASEIIQIGMPVARLELLDQETVKALNAVSNTSLVQQPTLFIELSGTPLQVQEQAEYVKEIASSNGCLSYHEADKPEERSRLWKARHDAALSIATFATGTEQWWTDVCVPISRLAECIVATQADLATSGLFAPILGHVGDGNFHVGICVDPDSDAQARTAELLHDRLVRRALEMEGTCTGEHGIGMGKQSYLVDELGGAVDVMRSIKAALDPGNIMNPGKIF